MNPASAESASVGVSSLAVTLNRLITLLSFGGVFVAGALSYSSLTGKSIPCGAAAGCDAVSSHPSSQWFGVPVAVVGLLGYLFLAALALGRTYGPPDLWKPLTKVSFWGSVFGFGATLYFVYTSLAVIQQTCSWCMASAGIMTVLFLLTVFLAQQAAPGVRPRPVDGVVAMAGALLAIGGVGGYGAYVASAGDAAMAGIDVSKIDEAEIMPVTAKIRGPIDAPVTVVEFADVNCVACRRSKEAVTKAILATNGGARWAFRHLPLIEIPGHETSMQAAVIAEYAASQGRFWEFMDAAFSPSNDERVKSVEGLISIARDVGLDGPAARRALTDGSPEVASVLADFDLALRLNVRSTPTFVVIARGMPTQVVTASRLPDLLRSPPYRSLMAGR